MPLFRYSALSLSGKKISGIIDADSLLSAKDRLRKDQILVTNVQIFKEKKKKSIASLSLLLNFTRMLTQLLNAGIPLYEGLVIIQEKYKKHQSHALWADLTDSLKSGLSFSEALEKHSYCFNEIYICMVRAGESSGTLDQALHEICLLLNRQHQLKKQISSALIYPVFLSVFCIFIFLILVLFVIPSLKTLFDGKALPPLTKIIFSISDFFISYGIILGIGVIATIISGYLCFLTQQFKLKWDYFLLRIPFIGDFIVQASMVRFCRTAALLLVGGVSILETLRLSRKAINNYFLERFIETVEKKVGEGESLSEELKNSYLIPPIIPRMLSIAEKTGKTADMLQSIANIFEENLGKRLLQFTTLLQPILLLILGIIVGIVLLSILIPLTDVGSVLQM